MHNEYRRNLKVAVTLQSMTTFCHSLLYADARREVIERAFRARCHTHSYVGARCVRRGIVCMHKYSLRMLTYGPNAASTLCERSARPQRGRRTLTERCGHKMCQGRIHLSPAVWVIFQLSHFYQIFHLQSKKKNIKVLGYRSCICITNMNNRDFYVHQGISMKEYTSMGISTSSYTILPPPP